MQEYFKQWHECNDVFNHDYLDANIWNNTQEICQFGSFI